MCLQKLIVRPVLKTEEARFRALMQRRHYLGFVPKIGQTLWYVGCIEGNWTSLLGFSVAALKCKARDKWIGWGHRRQYGRLKLIANNNRFLILPGWHIRNLASRTISLCRKAISLFRHGLDELREVLLNISDRFEAFRSLAARFFEAAVPGRKCLNKVDSQYSRFLSCT